MSFFLHFSEKSLSRKKLYVEIISTLSDATKKLIEDVYKHRSIKKGRERIRFAEVDPKILKEIHEVISQKVNILMLSKFFK